MKLTYNGRTIGILQNRKLIKSGKHVVFMRSMDGFGIPRELVEGVSDKTSGYTSAMMFDTVEIHYSGKVYRASVDDFIRHGIHYYRPNQQAQYILPRKFFVTEDTNQMRLI